MPLSIPSEEALTAVFDQFRSKGALIQEALARKKIRPHFQPICDARSGTVLIHELLMRIEVEGNMVAADDFIDVAESMGVVHRMDYQLIEQAFAQMKSQGYGGKLFINLSPRALVDAEFTANVRTLADAQGISPEQIVFEMTEMGSITDLDMLERFARDLRQQGFSFAIDKFGFGSSSYQYIKLFPVDYIKIEGEFVRHMLDNEVYQAFVKGIITLASSLNIRTVALCVENAAVLDKVRELGVDFAQGFHIGHPATSLTGTTTHPA